ncbi:MAG: Ig-like domain-containing protein [Planctomycetota bacterium]|nr:Ig-like domain-containing protein [Planctomycetota bacterium]
MKLFGRSGLFNLAMLAVACMVLNGCGGGGGGKSRAPLSISSGFVSADTNNAQDFITILSQSAVTVEVDTNKSIQATDDVQVTLADGATPDVVSSQNGFTTPPFQVTLIDASSLNQGSITVTIEILRGGSTVSGPFTGTSATKDTTTPEAPTASGIPTGPSNPANYINIVTTGAATVEVTVGGAGLVAADTLEARLGGATGITDTASGLTGNGPFPLVFNDGPLSDGPLAVEARVRDEAGNLNTGGFIAGTSATKDTAIPTPTASNVSAGGSNPLNSINPNNQAAVDVLVTLGAAAVATDTIEVRLGGGAGPTQTLNGVTGLGPHTVAGVNATTLAEGPVAVEARIFDLGGNDSAFVTGTSARKDTVQPNFVSSVPADLATGILTGSTVTATFDESLDPTSVNGTSFTLMGGGPVGGTVTYDDPTLTATFTPGAPLQESTTYTATLTSAIRDVAYNALGAVPVTFEFTTGDFTDPMVTGQFPMPGATAVPENTLVTATFSEDMNPGTINGATFTLMDGGSVAGGVSYDAPSRTATFTPTSPLMSRTLYTATVTTGAQDLSGRGMAANAVWMFTTVVDMTPPMVTGQSPFDTETNVATNRAVTVTFSEDMAAGTIDNVSFTLTAAVAGAIAGGVFYDNPTRTATFTPTASLATGELHTIALAGTMTDLAGNPLAYTPTSFTAAGVADIIQPFVLGFNPADGLIEVTMGGNQVILFSEPMNKALTEAAFSIAPTAANGAQFFWNAAGDQVTVVFDTTNPLGIEGDDILLENTAYTVTVGLTAEDLAGNPLDPAGGVTNTATWTTRSDVTAPRVTTFVPDIRTNVLAAGQFDVGDSILISFNEPMNTGVSPLVRMESPNDQREIPAGNLAAAWVGNDIEITFLMTPLLPNARYRLDLESGSSIQDAAFNDVDDRDVQWMVVTAGTLPGAPTIVTSIPIDGATDVPAASLIVIQFSQPMRPDILSQISITGNGSTQFDMENPDFTSAVIITGLQAWPAGQLITVTVAGTATSASGVSFGTPDSVSFTIASAPGATTWGINGPYSTLNDGETDIIANSITIVQGFLFMDAGGNLSFPNLQTVQPQDIVLRETSTGIVLKGYRVAVGEDGDVLLSSGMFGPGTFPGFSPSTAYELIFNPSFLDFYGNPITATTINFTTAATAGNTRPDLRGVLDEVGENLSVTPGGLTVQFRANVFDPDFGDVLTVDAQSDVDVAFSPTLMETFPGNFEYQTPGADEASITTRNVVHPITFTITDGGGGHSLTIKSDMFAWDVADVPFNIGPTGAAVSRTPTYTFDVTAAARAEAQIVAIFVLENATGNQESVFLVGIPPGVGPATITLDHPVDNPLAATTDYDVQILMLKFASTAVRGQMRGVLFNQSAAPFTTVP